MSADILFTEIRPQLAELEASRLDLRKKAKKWLIPGIVVGGAGVIAAFFFVPLGIVLIIVGLGLALIPRAIYSKKYKKSFKTRVLPILANAVCPGVRHHHKEHISRSVFSSSKIFQQGIDRYNGEDLFVGEMGKTEIRFSEVHAEEKHTTTDSKGNTKTHYETIFRGLFFVTEVHKHFKGETFVLPDFSEKLLGRLGRKLQKWNWGRPDLVVLESPEFESQFVVYGSDQIESRYLLTPNMMERIMHLRKKFKASVYLSFRETNLYIAISQKQNLFEVGFNDSLLNAEEIERILDELSACFGIVKDLDLNTRIWSKA